MTMAPPTKTYPNNKAALAGEQARYEKGEITKADLDRVTKELSAGVPTKTFKDAKSALANAQKLLDDGEISHDDYAKLEKKLVRQDQEGDLKAWLDRRYGPDRK